MEYSAPATLETPAGNLTMNGASDYLRLTSIAGMDSPELRTPIDNRAQQDGSIVHRFFTGSKFPVIEGYFKAATVSLRNTYEDNLKAALFSILRTDGRFRYTLTGKSERFITCRYYSPLVIEQIDGILHSFQFGLVTSREPFSFTYTETDTTIASGGSQVIANAGTAPMWANISVYGGAGANAAFTITNETTGKSLSLSGVTGITGSDWANILMYRQTIYKNDTGANMLPFLDPSSDFWTLEPGNNTISLTGSFDHAVVKSNDGWL